VASPPLRPLPDRPLRVVTALDLDGAARGTLAAALAPYAELHHLPRWHGDPAGLADAQADVLLAHSLPSRRDAVPRVRWAHVVMAGVDHLVLDEQWDDVALTSSVGLFTVPIAEYVLGALLFAAQHVPERYARWQARSWDDRRSLSGRLLAGATVVLLGYGSIGREVARLATALRLRVVAVKARPAERRFAGFAEPGTGDPDGSLPAAIVGVDRLAEVAAQADYLVISLPLTPATRHLVDRTVLAALRPDAWLVNVGRGAVVDEAALVDALHRRALGGAVLDVFTREPLPVDDPLWSAPNAYLTPHVSGVLERWDVLGQLLAENLRRHRAGAPLLNRVERTRGY
jgi:phosphoglycerate dehydrogenase-like enzyme